MIKSIATGIRYDRLFILGFALAAGLIILSGPQSALIMAGMVLGVVLAIKRRWLISCIILALFFEGHVFSFYIFGARVRAVQLLECAGLLSILLYAFSTENKPVRTPLDIPLAAYLAANVIALANAPVLGRSAKIVILLLSLAFLYYLVLNLLSERKIFDKAFNLLLYAGVAEIGYGLYQVFAGASNHYLKTEMPVGPSGVVHREFIGAPWGRPYGTLFEPDWYGAVAMFFALVFICLYFQASHRRKVFYMAGIIVSVLGLFLSFVRACWFGFLVGLIFLAVYSGRVRRSTFRMHTWFIMISAFLISALILAYASPLVSNVIRGRFSSGGISGLSVTNVRFVQVVHSAKLFMAHPLIGNGPGIFDIEGIWGHSEEYFKELALRENNYLLRRYNPSILATVLEDTGIIGFLFFLWFIFRFLKYNCRAIPSLGEDYQVSALGLFIGLVGVLASYIFTHGLWIPFTWVLIGFDMAALRLGEKA